MIETSVDAQSPPGQDRVIASWGTGLLLVDRGTGTAAVIMRIDGFWVEVARVPYGSYAVTSTVEWNNAGMSAMEEYKRNFLDTKIYSKIAQWLRGPR